MPQYDRAQCECNEPSYEHSPYACQHAGYIVAIRDGKQLLLCGDCILSSDDKVTTVSDSENGDTK